MTFTFFLLFFLLTYVHEHTTSATSWLCSWCFCTVTATLSSTPSRDTTIRHEFQSLEGTFHITPPLVICILWGQGKNMINGGIIMIWIGTFVFYFCSFFQFRGVQAQSWTGTILELTTDRCCVRICFLPVFILIVVSLAWIQTGKIWYLFSTGIFCISEFLNRENNVCDINPVHYLFATGTSEVSAVYVCAYNCLSYGLSMLPHSQSTQTCFLHRWGHLFFKHSSVSLCNLSLKQ